MSHLLKTSILQGNFRALTPGPNANSGEIRGPVRSYAKIVLDKPGTVPKHRIITLFSG